MFVLNIFLFLSFLDMNMNSIPVHLIQGIVTKQSIKTPNRVKKKKRKKRTPITTVTQRKCNGVCSYKSSKASGKWETIPTNLFGGNYTQCFVILLII